MFCKNCGSPLKEGDRFCGDCGFDNQKNGTSGQSEPVKNVNPAVEEYLKEQKKNNKTNSEDAKTEQPKEHKAASDADTATEKPAAQPYIDIKKINNQADTVKNAVGEKVKETSEKVKETSKKVDEKMHQPVQIKKDTLKKLGIIAAAVIVVLIGLSALKGCFTSEHAVKKFATALQKQNWSTVSKMIKMDEDSFVTKDTLIAYFNDNPNFFTGGQNDIAGVEVEKCSDFEETVNSYYDYDMFYKGETYFVLVDSNSNCNFTATFTDRTNDKNRAATVGKVEKFSSTYTYLRIFTPTTSGNYTIVVTPSENAGEIEMYDSNWELLDMSFEYNGDNMMATQYFEKGQKYSFVISPAGDITFEIQAS